MDVQTKTIVHGSGTRPIWGLDESINREESGKHVVGREQRHSRDKTLCERACSCPPSTIKKVELVACYWTDTPVSVKDDTFPDISTLDALPASISLKVAGEELTIDSAPLVADFRKIDTALCLQLNERIGIYSEYKKSEEVRDRFNQEYSRAFEGKLFWSREKTHTKNPVFQFKLKAYEALRKSYPNAYEATLIYTANLICRAFCNRFIDEILVRKNPVVLTNTASTQAVSAYELATVRSCSRRPVNRYKKSTGKKKCTKTIKANDRELNISILESQLDWAKNQLILDKATIGAISQCVSTIQDRNYKNCNNWTVTNGSERHPVYHVSHGRRCKNSARATLFFYILENQPHLLSLAEHSRGNSCYAVLQAMPGVNMKKEYDLEEKQVFTAGHGWSPSCTDSSSSSGYGSGSSSDTDD